MKTAEKVVNVAPSSESGHFVKGAKNVIELDAINETFLVEGDSILETKNHTSLDVKSKSLVTCQTVYNPYSKMFEKSKD